MKILHIGDYHFKSGRKHEYDQQLVVDKLLEKIEKISDVEFLFFTGDLVFSGSKYEDFEKAHNLLIDPLQKSLKISDDRIFICPGNHDIDRTKCSPAIIEYLDKKIRSNEELNEYCLNNSSDFKNSLHPSDNFYTYLNKYFPTNKIVHRNLCNLFIQEYNGKRLGIVSLNSAWLSSGFEGRIDKNNLLISTSVIKNALAEINQCTVKILLVHHPLHSLREMNYHEIEDLIHREFNLMFSGHLHKEKIETRYNANNGIFCNTTQATLTFDKTGEIGYSIINFDIEDETTVIIDRCSYFKKDNRFMELDSVVATIPCGQNKVLQNKLRQKITGKYQIELHNANQLLLNYDENSDSNFIESFTDPVIDRNSDTEAVTLDAESKISFEDDILTLKDNYLLFGRDKCGKTSLLKKIQLHYIKNYTALGIVPFYFDYKEWERVEGSFNLERSIANYFQINNNDAKNIIADENLVFLIDNLNSSSEIHNVILKELTDHPRIKFVICSDYIASRIFREDLDDLQYQRLYFKDLTRKEIRKYTEKIPSLRGEDKDIVHERITNLCKQLYLPVNYWTVSLITLIYKKSNNDYNKNLFSILDVCVDEILNKKKLAISIGDIKFEQYKEICSEIAYYLLTEHRDNIYSASHDELITFIVSIQKRNPRIVGDSRDIFEYLFDVGILKKKNNRYTFRLNGIFEYFLAYYLKDHKIFIDKILSDDSIFLSFKNELEIYSGFNRKDEEFLNKLFDKVKKIFQNKIDGYKTEYGTADQTLIAKLGNAEGFVETIKSLKVSQPLSLHAQDSIRDELQPISHDSEVHLKEFSNNITVNYEVLEKYLSIISRVYKNSDSIQNLSLIDEIFDYLLDAYCTLGFILIDEFENYAVEENLKSRDRVSEEHILGEEMIKIIARFIPILTQSLLYDGIGHANLSKIIQTKIDKLKQDSKNNQFKLFLLYFLLIDIDVKKNKDLIDEIFEVINMPTLKVSTLFKLNFYHAFKTIGNNTLEGYFLNKIQKAQLRIDNKVSADDLQSPLSKKRNQVLVKTN